MRIICVLEYFNLNFTLSYSMIDKEIKAPLPGKQIWERQSFELEVTGNGEKIDWSK